MEKVLAWIKANTLLTILGIAVFLFIVFSGQYNSFITQTNAIDGQWKQVEVQYQRRFDLIPNLVEASKGLMQQEQKVFGDLASARAAYSGAQTVNQKAAAASQVESSLGRLLAIFENYPQLKSDQTILKLQDELAGTENRVSVERRRFNEFVQTYNTSVTTVPGVFYARIFGFSTRAYFNSTLGSETAPKVKF